MLQSSQLHGDLVAQSFANAVQTYRRSVDLYRRVVAMRVQREARILQRVVGPPSPPRLSVVTSAARLIRVSPRGARLDPLTPREREVATLIARGYSNQQIAETLVLTKGTVANHVAHILSKLGATNRTQVAAHVLRPAPPMASAAD